LPQIAQVFHSLSRFDLPKNVIDLYEAKNVLSKVLEKRK